MAYPGKIGNESQPPGASFPDLGHQKKPQLSDSASRPIPSVTSSGYMRKGRIFVNFSKI